jgi:hypothetical protein
MKKISMFAAALVIAVLSFATSVSADTVKSADCCPSACCADGGACCQ